MSKSLIEQFAETIDGLKLLQQEKLKLEITELICKIMNQQGIARSDLAQKLNLSKGRISQILNGETNLTSHTIANIFTVLGKELDVSAKDLYKKYKPVLIGGTIDEYEKPKDSWHIPSPKISLLDTLDIAAETQYDLAN